MWERLQQWRMKAWGWKLLPLSQPSSKTGSTCERKICSHYRVPNVADGVKRTLSKDQTHTIHWATARFLRCQTTSYTNSIMFCFPCLKSDFLWNLFFFSPGRTHSCLYSCKHSDLQTAQYNQSDLLATELHHWEQLRVGEVAREHLSSSNAGGAVRLRRNKRGTMRRSSDAHLRSVQ